MSKVLKNNFCLKDDDVVENVVSKVVTLKTWVKWR